MFPCGQDREQAGASQNLPFCPESHGWPAHLCWGNKRPGCERERPAVACLVPADSGRATSRLCAVHHLEAEARAQPLLRLTCRSRLAQLLPENVCQTCQAEWAQALPVANPTFLVPATRVQRNRLCRSG